MSVVREALVLPVLYLTVALLGALRLGDRVVLMPPSVFTLVLGFMLLGALVRSGTLYPARLMNASRSGLANLNGLVVLLTAVVASAQVFSVMTPGRGLPRLAFGTFFLIVLLNTFAAAPDRVRLLRSLTVIFGSAFLMKFVVLAAVSGPASGALARVLLVLLEGATLGAVTQDALHPGAGYLALLALVLFLTATALLPSSESGVRSSESGVNLQLRN